MSFTAFLIVVVLGGGLLILLARGLAPLASFLLTLVKTLFGSPGGWALIVGVIVVFLLASGGFLQGVM